jgi:F-type H+-transporting ATPase subunit alpha
VDDVVRFEKTLLETLRSKGTDILSAIKADKQIKPETEEKLKALLVGFVESFA